MMAPISSLAICSFLAILSLWGAGYPFGKRRVWVEPRVRFPGMLMRFLERLTSRFTNHSTLDKHRSGNTIFWRFYRFTEQLSDVSSLNDTDRWARVYWLQSFLASVFLGAATAGWLGIVFFLSLPSFALANQLNS